MRLFDRECSATVGGSLITGLRMAFRVQKSVGRDPNTMELTITNLSAQTRAALQDAEVPVTISAGYKGTARVLFVGTVRRIQHVRQGTDWETRLQSGDGEKAIRDARVNTSLAPGATLADAVKAAASSLGVPIGNAVEKLRNGNIGGAFSAFSGGVALHGPAATHMDRLLATAGYTWSIQDGVLQLLRVDEPNKELAVVLSPQSGLVGSPEFGERQSVRARSLLQPDLRPGRRVQLESETARGLYRCEAVTHVGDTAGAAWFSECDLRRL